MGTEPGFYWIKSFQDVLYVKSFGYWDDRTAQAFSGDLRGRILSGFDQGPWCVLHDAGEWQLGIPEVETLIREFVTLPITGRLTHHALVSGRSELKNWQLDKMFTTFVPFKHRRFDDVGKAREWLMAAGYSIPDL